MKIVKNPVAKQGLQLLTSNVSELTNDSGFLTAETDPLSLRLDQTTPQTVSSGQPIFEEGLEVPSTTGGTWSIYLSPLKYNDICYYIPEDAAATFYFSPTEDFQLVFDMGSYSPILIDGLVDSQPTIYVHLCRIFGGEACLTCYSDLDATGFLPILQALSEDPSATIDYSETAFTFADGVYTNVTTKPVCEYSAATEWANPMWIKQYGGFIVGENVFHTTNYTNGNVDSIFKTKGQIKAGNGNLIDLVTCPITSNPKLNLSGGGLQFAMTFVPEIISTGTVDTPINSSVYASGVYGTTAFEGGYATYSGTALGMWCAVQNAISGPTTLKEGIGIRAGMTYSSESNSEMYVRDMICFQTDFTNLNNGTSKHDTIKHYEAKLLSNNVNSVTDNFAFYAADNSVKATNSWGLYSLEPSNYAKGLSVDGIVKPLAPIQINLVTSGFARALRIVPKNNVLGYGGYIEFGTSLTADGYGPQIGGVRTDNGAGDFVIRTGGNAQKERVRVTNGGLVGIGKTPTTILDILKSSEANLTTGLRLQNNFSTTNTAIGIDFTLSSADVILARIHAIRTNINNSARTDLVFSTYNSTLGEAMRLTGAGDLGIGMTPVEKLDVNGNVKATGYKSSDGSEGQTTTVTVVTDTRMNIGQLQKKTQVLTYKNGLLTDKAAESDWTNTTDI